MQQKHSLTVEVDQAGQHIGRAVLVQTLCEHLQLDYRPAYASMHTPKAKVQYDTSTHWSARHCAA